MTVGEAEVIREVLQRGHKCTMTQRDLKAAEESLVQLETQHEDATKALRTIDSFLKKTNKHKNANWGVWVDQLLNIVDIGLGDKDV